MLAEDQVAGLLDEDAGDEGHPVGRVDPYRAPQREACEVAGSNQGISHAAGDHEPTDHEEDVDPEPTVVDDEVDRAGKHLLVHLTDRIRSHIEVERHDEERCDPPQPVDEDVAGFGLLGLRGLGGFVAWLGDGRDLESGRWGFGLGTNQFMNTCANIN
jgi:hypothetical protein